MMVLLSSLADDVNTEFLVNVREIDRVVIDCETTYDYVIGLEFVWFIFKSLQIQMLAIDECVIRAFDILAVIKIFERRPPP
jgi:hypothetical protein